jgi:hypothetical protein
MKHRSTSWSFAALVGMTCFSATACVSSQQNAAQPKASPSRDESAGVADPTPVMTPAAAVEKPKPVMTPAAAVESLPPPGTDTSTTPRRSLTMSESRATVETSTAIPSPPAKIDVPPQTRADATTKAVPTTVPESTLSQSALEGPLRDRARFDHCRIPQGTHGEIAAVIYNGAAVEVDVKTTPNDRALNFCIERTVRQMSWVKDVAVNKVNVPF